MDKIVVVVSVADKYGKRTVAGAWLAQHPDPERAIAAAAKAHDVSLDVYKETFSPEVWEFNPALLPNLP